MQQFGDIFGVIILILLPFIGVIIWGISEVVMRMKLAQSGVKVDGHITDHLKEGSYRYRKYYIAYTYDYQGSTYSRKERVSILRFYMSDEFDGPIVSVYCLPDNPKIARLGYKIPTSIPILPKQPLPEPNLTSTAAIPQLKPAYHGSETSITGSVTLSIIQQSPDGHLRAKWVLNNLGREYLCEGTITPEGNFTLTSTGSRNPILHIYGSLTSDGQLEGSLDDISKDGSSQRQSWNLA